MKIYVGNLSYNTSEDDMRAAFASFGTVDSADIITDRETGRSKGFGFVEMSNNAEAHAAMEGLDGKELDDRSLTVNEARPRTEGGSRSNRGSRRY